MDTGALLQLVGGLFTLSLGVQQARRVPLLRRNGARSLGTVARVDQVWDAEEQVWNYTPVIAFRDESGTERQLVPDTSTSWATHEPGQQVTVVYPSGRPEAARLKSGAHSALNLVGAGLSAIFIVVGLVLLGSFVYGIRS
ncbi:DUF3592 domain-containing protein [Micromonosporaceae bacterium Da 78-11]